MLSNPLILTLTMADREAAYFNRLRIEHFPADRNFIDAHLTMFHQLPGEERVEINRTISTLAAETSPISFQVTGLIGLGRGVAFKIASPGLVSLRKRLASAFASWLTPQDRNGFRPHVTIQNKVEAAEAKALHAELTVSFAPFGAEAPGLDLWAYLGGPWRHEGHFPFACRTAENGAGALVCR